MLIEYVKDEHVPHLWNWSSKSEPHPLHPQYGPLPDMRCLYNCRFCRPDRETEINELLDLCLWITDTSLIVTLEMLKDEDPIPNAPALSYEEVSTMHGWIMQTYRWVLSDGMLCCSDQTILLPKYKEDEAWRRRVCQIAMEGSIRLATRP